MSEQDKMRAALFEWWRENINDKPPQSKRAIAWLAFKAGAAWQAALRAGSERTAEDSSVVVGYYLRPKRRFYPDKAAGLTALRDYGGDETMLEPLYTSAPHDQRGGAAGGIGHRRRWGRMGL